MLPPIPSSPPGVVVKDDTSSATTKYPVFASVVNGQVVFEGVSSTKLYFVPSTGVLTATGFAGAGTGLTGTAAGLSIGGNAATSTLATSATNLAGGLANQLPVQTASGVTSFIGAPSTSGSFLQWTTGGGFAWTLFNGVTSFSAGTTGFTPSSSTTGAITLAGTLNAANGGTGASGLTGYVYGNGTGTMTASTTIPNTAITGLGTMSTQNANAVAITGGSLNGVNIGASVAGTGAFTTLMASATTNTTPVLSFNGSNTILALGATVSGSYLQTILQNKSGAASASTNYVVSNDLGTDSIYYGEFGMNSSVYSSGTPSDFFSINNGIYFSGHDGDISVGSGNGFKTYLAWGTTGQSAHVINASGALGFSTNLGTTPALSGTTGYGTSGQTLISAGSSAAPAWGVLTVPGGGTGNATLSGLAYGNGVAAFTAATAAQVVSVIGTTAVTNATNLAGGAANQLAYQTGSGATSFISAPTIASTFLEWNGTSFVWATPSVIGVNSVVGTPPINVSTTLGVATVSLNANYGDTLNPYASKTANTFLSAPNGSSGTPSFRALVAADIPSTYSQFPAGTALLFNQTSAPTGWTKVTTNDNAALRVVSGTVGSGGSAAFTTAFASQTPSGSVGTSISAVSGSVGVSLSGGGSVSSYTLATSDIPSHNHQTVPNGASGSLQWGSGPTIAGLNASAYASGTGAYSSSTGGGGSHSHGFTNPSYSGSFTFSSGTASSSFTGTAINLAVKYVDVIIATKN